MTGRLAGCPNSGHEIRSMYCFMIVTIGKHSFDPLGGVLIFRENWSGKEGCTGGDLIVVLFAVLLSAALTD